MKMLRGMIIAAVGCMAMLAVAQGGGRQGFGMGFMGGGDSSGIMLLQREDVKRDLKLSDDQKSKLTAQQDKARDDMREIFQNANGDRDQMQADMKKFFEKSQKDIAAILTKEQAARLKEINIQIAGNGAVLFPDVQKDLGLTDDQVTKIKDLQSKQRDAMQGLGEKMRNQELSFEEFQDAMKKNRDILNTEIGKVLTSDQKAKLKTMGGKEFKADADDGG